MRKNRIIGSKYLPTFYGEWQRGIPYAPLTMVTYQGDSYISKKQVPINIDITNNGYWVVTGQYNAQLENYIRIVRNVANEVMEGRINETSLKKFNEKVIEKIENIDTKVNIMEIDVINFGAKGDGITDDTSAIQNALNYIKNRGYGKLSFSKPKICYLIKNRLTIPSNIEINFRNSKILALYENANSVIHVENVKNVILNNVNIESKFTHVGTGFLENALCSLVTGIRIIKSSNIHINSFNTDYLDFGLKIDGSGIEGNVSNDIYINDVNIINTWNPLYATNCNNFKGKNVVLKAFTTQNGFLNGIYINGNVNNFSIDNLDIENISGTAIGTKVETETSIGNKNLTFKNVTVKNVRNAFTHKNSDDILIDGYNVENCMKLIQPNNVNNIKLLNGNVKNVTDCMCDITTVNDLTVDNLVIDCESMSYRSVLLPRGNNLSFNDVTFKNLPSDKQFIFNNVNDVVTNCKFNNCNIIVPNGSKVLVDVRSSSDIIIQNSYFENTNNTYEHLCLNLESSNVLVRDCTLNGYNKISGLSTDKTKKFNNFDLKNNKALTE